MSTRNLLLVILILVLIFGVPFGYNAIGVYPAGGVGLIILILIVLLILGKI